MAELLCWLQAAERAAREAQHGAALAREQARAAATAESATRALADNTAARAAAAMNDAQGMRDAVVACMEGMRMAEGVLGYALDKACSHLLRIEFAGERSHAHSCSLGPCCSTITRCH